MESYISYLHFDKLIFNHIVCEGKCMVVMKRIIKVDDNNLQQQNIINVDKQPAKTLKNRRKGQKPSFSQEKISYFDDYSGERKFSSSELKLKKISYFDDDYYVESAENEIEVSPPEVDKTVEVVSQESYDDYESDEVDDSIDDKGYD